MDHNVPPRVFVSPMSIEIVNAVLEYRNVSKNDVGFVATQNQVCDRFSSGYLHPLVNLAMMKNYCDAVSPGVWICSDHGEAVYTHYDISHYDSDKEIPNMSGWLGKIKVEIGTEPARRKIDPDGLDLLIKDATGKGYNVVFAVVQTDTKLFNMKNEAEKFNKKYYRRYVDMCKQNGARPKEHNCDYLNSDQLWDRFSNGLYAMNIGPELINKQNLYYANELKTTGRYKTVVDILKYGSDHWKRWTDKDEMIVATSLHYKRYDGVIGKFLREIEAPTEQIKRLVWRRLDEIFGIINATADL